MLIVFCNQLGDNPLMKSLVYEPDKALQAQLSDFIQKKVFVDDDDGNDEVFVF